MARGKFVFSKEYSPNALIALVLIVFAVGACLGGCGVGLLLGGR